MSSNHRWDGGHRVARRITWVGLTLVALNLIPLADHAGAGSGQTSDQVAKEILRIQAKADAAAQAWGELDTEATNLADQITTAQHDVDATSASAGTLQQGLAAIAVNRYTSGGGSSGGLLGEDPTIQLQKDALSDVAIGVGNVNLDTYEAVQKSLAAKQKQLDALQQKNTAAQAQLALNQQKLNDQIAQLQALEVNLKDAEVKAAYDKQVAAQRAKIKAAADKAAARVSAAAATPVVASPQNNGGASSASSTQSAQISPSDAAATNTTAAAADVGPGPTTTQPAPHQPAVIVGGSWICPVAGPNAFGHTFGDPRPGGRHHEGVDMISPFGTPLVAVVSGDVTMKTNALGGNAMGLKGDDGNYYYYAHLSSWEGPSRHVSAGEVIGYVGHTGDTTVNHLHFEIHPGGGPAVDPYNTLAAHC